MPAAEDRTRPDADVGGPERASTCAEVTDGLPIADGPRSGVLASGPTGEPVRAALVKAGVGYWNITAFERRVLTAATCHHQTGVAVMVHLEHGSAAFEVLDRGYTRAGGASA